MNNTNVFEDLNNYIINKCNTVKEIEENIPFIDENLIRRIKNGQVLNSTSSSAMACMCSSSLVGLGGIISLCGAALSSAKSGFAKKSESKYKNILREINKDNSNIQYDMDQWRDIVNNYTIDEIMNKVVFNNFSIHHYINHLKNYKEMTFKEIVEKSNIRESYLKPVFNIKNNKARRSPNRDCIIGLSFAFRLNILETNYLLQAAGYNELYLRNKRDMIICKSIMNNFSVKELNTYLVKFSCDKIGNWDEDEGSIK